MATLALSSAAPGNPGGSSGTSPGSPSGSTSGNSHTHHYHHHHHYHQGTTPTQSRHSSSSSGNQPSSSSTSRSKAITSTTSVDVSPTAAVQADARKRAFSTSVCDSNSKSSLGTPATPNYILLNKLRIQEQANARAAKAKVLQTSTTPSAFLSSSESVHGRNLPSSADISGGQNSIGSQRGRPLLRSSAVGGGDHSPPNRSSFGGNSSRPVVSKVTAQDWLAGHHPQRSRDTASSSRRPSSSSSKGVITTGGHKPSSISSSPCTSLHDHHHLHHHRSCTSSPASNKMTKVTSPPSKTLVHRPSLTVKSIRNSRGDGQSDEQIKAKQNSSSSGQTCNQQSNTKHDDGKADVNEVVVMTTTSETGDVCTEQTSNGKNDTTKVTTADQPSTHDQIPKLKIDDDDENALGNHDVSKITKSSPVISSASPTCDSQPSSSAVKLTPKMGPETHRGQLLFRQDRSPGSSRSGRDSVTPVEASARRSKRQTTLSNNSKKVANPKSNLLAFIEKSSPELIFLLSESAKLSYNLCQFEAKLDYLEQIFCSQTGSDNNSRSEEVPEVSPETSKISSQRSTSSASQNSWSSVISRTRNWIAGVRSKNVLLEKRPDKRKCNNFQFSPKLAKKRTVVQYPEASSENDEVEDESSSSVHSSEDELILLLDRIIKFSSNIVSRLNTSDQNFSHPQQLPVSSVPTKEVMDSAENVITTSEETDTDTVVSEKRKLKLSADSEDTINNNNRLEGDKTDQNADSIALHETLSSLSAESSARGRYEWLQSLPSNVKDLMRQLFPGTSSPSSPSSPSNTSSNKEKTNFEHIYELNPELLKALIENVKTNIRLVQLRREFDRLMCSHLKAIGHEVKSGSAKNHSKIKNSTSQKSTPAKRKKEKENIPVKFNNNNKWKGNFKEVLGGSTKIDGHLSSEGNNKSSHCHCHCANSNSNSNNQHLVSDGDSGGEFTATTVTNDFAPTNTGNTATTNAPAASTNNTDDELSSLLNQIAVCSAKIIEQQTSSTGGGATSGSCSSNNSNSTSSSSGCCCSSASLLDAGSGGLVGGVKCTNNSNSLTGSGRNAHFGSHHNLWATHHQSPPHSVNLKKSNMRHSSTLLATNCPCESCLKPNLNPIISNLKSEAQLGNMMAQKLVSGQHPYSKNNQMYSPSHVSSSMNRGGTGHHWSQTSFDEEYHHQHLGGTSMYGSGDEMSSPSKHHPLHSGPSYAIKRSAGMGALNEGGNTPSATPFTLGEHMTGFMFAPSAMDLLSAASCNSVIGVPPSAHPSANLRHQLGHYRHHSSGVLRGGGGNGPSFNDHQQAQPFYHLPNEPETTTNAFIFDPSVDVESFLNEVEKELDDNCYASAPPFMARNGQPIVEQRVGLPTGSGHHLEGGHGLGGGGGYPLSPHRNFGKSQHLNQIGGEGLQHLSPGHHGQAYQHSTPTLVNLNGKGAVYSSLNSGSPRAHPKMAPNYSRLANHEHSSSMLAGGNWRLSQRASTLDLAQGGGSSNTLTNSPNATITPGSTGTTSHFPFPSTASMPLTNHAASERARAGAPNNASATGSSSTGNLAESQRYKRLIVPSASRDLLDNFRAQVSHRVATETDSQLRQVEAWFQEQVQASMGARQSVITSESASDSSFGHGHQNHQNILQAADRRRFSADNINNKSSNSDLIYFG